jgi:hypothetical protein
MKSGQQQHRDKSEYTRHQRKIKDFSYSTVDPSAFEMPDAPANEAGVFLFSSEFRRKSAYGTKPT